MAMTGHNFYLWQKEGVIKPWVNDYGPIPINTTLLNPEKESQQIPPNVDIDIVLSQNKFGQFQIAKQIAEGLGVPLLSLEHTLPRSTWTTSDLEGIKSMRGDVNIFISEYSRALWGWGENEAEVIHHGIDTDLFSPSNVKREGRALSVVNDWVNRDWCCGYKIWEQVTGYPNPHFPVHVVGDTPGLSKSADSTEALVEEYRRSKVFLNTSTVSPVPTSLLEAMSCGCPVVTMSTCMIPEIIINGKNGYLSEIIPQLRLYVETLLDNDELVAEMGKLARQTILEHFALSDFVTNWNNIFFSCLEK